MTTDEAPESAIVIVTHNRPSMLEETLLTLSRCAFPAGPNEVLVVENGRRDCGSDDVVEKTVLPVPLRYYHYDDSSKARTLNYALRQTRAPFIIFFDDDIIFEKNCVAAYVNGARRYGPGHLFGGPHTAEGHEKPPEWLKHYLPPSASGFHLGDNEHTLNAPLFLGFNWAAFRQDLLSAGGFPTYLGPGQPYECGGGEETFMQERMLANGVKAVYLPDARVRHLVPPSNCSYEFALLRARHYGVIQTLANHIERRIPPRNLPPKWMVRNVVESTLLLLVSVVLGKSREQRMGTRALLSQRYGTLKGYFILRRYKLFDDALREADSEIAEETAHHGKARERRADAQAGVACPD